MAMYRSSEMTSNAHIDAVEHSTSILNHKSHKILPFLILVKEDILFRLIFRLIRIVNRNVFCLLFLSIKDKKNFQFLEYFPIFCISSLTNKSDY